MDLVGPFVELLRHAEFTVVRPWLQGPPAGGREGAALGSGLPLRLRGTTFPGMDHPEPLDTAPEVMHVERLVRDDGRLLLLFTWGDGTGESKAAESVTGHGPA